MTSNRARAFVIAGLALAIFLLLRKRSLTLFTGGSVKAGAIGMGGVSVGAVNGYSGSLFDWMGDLSCACGLPDHAPDIDAILVPAYLGQVAAYIYTPPAPIPDLPAQLRIPSTVLPVPVLTFQHTYQFATLPWGQTYLTYKGPEKLKKPANALGPGDRVIYLSTGEKLDVDPIKYGGKRAYTQLNLMDPNSPIDFNGTTYYRSDTV